MPKKELMTFVNQKPAEPKLPELLSRDEKGRIIQNNDNCQLVLKYDPLLKGAIRFNEFTGNTDVVKEMPWKRYAVTFSDNDLDNIITYMEKTYGLKAIYAWSNIESIPSWL